MTAPVRVLLISGSLRTNSTNSAVVATAAADAPESINATVYDGMAGLPHFNPDDDVDPLPAPVAELRDRIANSDAVLICTPEYAGALPGSFKNLLDWTVGGMAIQGKPVAWINASAAPTGAANAHESLRIVLGYVDADIIEPACRHIAVPRGVVGPDGLITDPEVRSQIIDTLTTLAHQAEAAQARPVS